MRFVDQLRSSAGTGCRCHTGTASAGSLGVGWLALAQPQPAHGRQLELAAECPACVRRGSPAAPPTAARSGKSLSARRRRQLRLSELRVGVRLLPLASMCGLSAAIMASLRGSPVVARNRCFIWDKPQKRAALRAPPPPAAAGVSPPEHAPAAACGVGRGAPVLADPPRVHGCQVERSTVDRVWSTYKQGVLMARRQRIRQAIDRARGNHRDAPPSLPLADQPDARAGTRPSVPGACGGLSGAPAPAPAWERGPLLDMAPALNPRQRQKAGLDHLLAVTKRRWWWLLPPCTTGRSLAGIPVMVPAANIAALIMRIELKLFRARMALSMWITSLPIIGRYYTLWRVGRSEKREPHP